MRATGQTHELEGILKNTNFHEYYIDKLEKEVLKDICEYSDYVSEIMKELIHAGKYKPAIKLYLKYKKSICESNNRLNETNVLNQMLVLYSKHNVPEMAYCSLKDELTRVYLNSMNDQIRRLREAFQYRISKGIRIASILLIIYSVMEIAQISIGDMLKNNLVDLIILIFLLGGLLMLLYCRSKNIGLYVRIVAWFQRFVFLIKYKIWVR